MGKYKGKFYKNQKFGNWTVETGEVIYHEKSRAYVECRCSCGRMYEVAAHHLLKGRSTRCNVCNQSLGKVIYNNPHWKGTGLVPKTVLTRASASAVTRHVPYDLTMDYVTNLYVESGGKCTVTGNTFSPLDESAKLVCKNPEIGYIRNNVMWVHTSVEPVIRKMSYDEFLKVCEEVNKNIAKEKVHEEKGD